MEENVESTEELEVETVTPDESDEVDTVAEGTESEAGEKQAKAPKEPARGDLSEGYVTPVGLAKILSQPIDGDKENLEASNWYHTDKAGGHDVKPQMVYSYKKNAPKEDPFPSETVTDSLGNARENVLKLEDGIAWWLRKNARVEERKANAAKKEEAKAERAKKAEEAKAAGTTAEGAAPAEAVVEAE